MNQTKPTFVRQFQKVFSAKPDDHRTEIPEDQRVGFIEPTNVAMVVPKTEEYKALIPELFDVTESRIPDLKFSRGGRSKFSAAYLRPLFEMVKKSEHVYIEVMGDYPLRAETPDFIYIVAPRVENE